MGILDSGPQGKEHLVNQPLTSEGLLGLLAHAEATPTACEGDAGGWGY